ncbi:hypothetical protein F3Y22_tig00117056pilonHSYRG01205 [Hibiscus syriacus]|uniref:START domain-containing protein n=1 Tax=Hibiscus syriacus TaxID=106335 RepID=A0A6A2WBL3_HIBSY|nr:hypothetical protein F3Y22_tig00117056pilonHSYRG01205 [Hibiscus syriacus]
MDNMGENGSGNIQQDNNLEELFNSVDFDNFQNIIEAGEEDPVGGFQAALRDEIEVADCHLGLDQPPEMNPEENAILHSNEEFSSPSLYNPQSLQNSPGSESSTNVKPDQMNWASDLLMPVSIGADLNKNKIIEQAIRDMDELIKMATMGEPLWQRQGNGGMETLNGIQYLREFGCFDATMEDIIRMVEIGEPELFPSFDYFHPDNQTPTFLKPEFEPLNVGATRDIGLVNMNTMNIVELLMNSKQWSMVFSSVVSRATVLGVILDTVDGSCNGVLQVFRRRPSGCLIQEMSNMSKSITNPFTLSFVPLSTPVLHSVPNHGSRFSTGIANGWQLPWLEPLLLMLEVAERMTRKFFMNISSCTENTWIGLPSNFGAEDVRFRFGNTLAVPGKPPSNTLIITTSVPIPVPVNVLFNFFHYEHSRHKERLVRELAYVITGEILRISFGYASELFTPMDTFSVSLILNGGNSNDPCILSSGFAILPDKPSGQGDGPVGSILTIAFQSADNVSRNELIPVLTLKTIDVLLASTIASIRDVMVLLANRTNGYVGHQMACLEGNRDEET